MTILARSILYTNSPGPVLTATLRNRDQTVIPLTGKDVYLGFRGEYATANAFKKAAQIVSAPAGTVKYVPILSDWGDEQPGIYNVQWLIHAAGGLTPEQHLDAGQVELRVGF